eukprot:3294324-Rhodomonas_salina.1
MWGEPAGASLLRFQPGFQPGRPRQQLRRDARVCAVWLRPLLVRRLAQVPPSFSLRTCYAMSGTDIACTSRPASFLPTCYMISGTNQAYSSASTSFLSTRPLHHVRNLPRVSCYQWARAH